MLFRSLIMAIIATKIKDNINERKKIISKNYDYFFEDSYVTQSKNIINSIKDTDKIYTYSLSYYWLLPDFDYCTLTGFLPDLYSKHKKIVKSKTDLFLILNQNPLPYLDKDFIDFIESEKICLCWFEEDKISTLDTIWNKNAISWLR